MVGLGHGPVLLRRLPVNNRVDETTSKQVSSTASAFVSSACYLTVVSFLGSHHQEHGPGHDVKVARPDVVAEAVFVWAIAREKSRIEEVTLVNPHGLATRRP